MNEFKEVCSSFPLSLEAHFDLKGSPGPISKLDDCINVQVLGVTMVIYVPIMLLRIHLQVPDDHRLKEKASVLEVTLPDFRTC